MEVLLQEPTNYGFRRTTTAMAKDSTPSEHFSANATLAAIGLKLQALKLFSPIEETVTIQQKTIDHTPADKLKAALIAMLAGAHGICEINTLLRSDPALQRAFGREACAEQSTVQDTLDACTDENVLQMQEAFTAILRTHSRVAHHNFRRDFLVVDGDLTGLPCGPKAEGSDKGYLSGEGIRHGRQLGRMVATQYDEVVVDQVYPGNTVMAHALRYLVQGFEQALGLQEDEKKRSRTILRFDAAAGSLDDVNWLLSRGYQLHGKDYSSVRARALATTVRTWYDDPMHPGRQVGLIGADSLDYVRQIRRIAVRTQQKNSQWMYMVLHTTLSSEQILGLVGVDPKKKEDEAAVLLAYAHFYDQRGGGCETEIKQDKQTGMRKRQKKRLAAQRMVQLLTALAHNVVIWSREWLAPKAEKVKKLGVKRIIRDLFRVSGRIVLTKNGKVRRIVLNEADPLGRAVASALAALLSCEHVAVRLGEL